jgi:hypothetical protein
MLASKLARIRSSLARRYAGRSHRSSNSHGSPARSSRTMSIEAVAITRDGGGGDRSTLRTRASPASRAASIRPSRPPPTTISAREAPRITPPSARSGAGFRARRFPGASRSRAAGSAAASCSARRRNGCAPRAHPGFGRKPSHRAYPPVGIKPVRRGRATIRSIPRWLIAWLRDWRRKSSRSAGLRRCVACAGSIAGRMHIGKSGQRPCIDESPSPLHSLVPRIFPRCTASNSVAKAGCGMYAAKQCRQGLRACRQCVSTDNAQAEARWRVGRIDLVDRARSRKRRGPAPYRPSTRLAIANTVATSERSLYM